MEQKKDFWAVAADDKPYSLGLVSRTRALADTAGASCKAVWAAEELPDVAVHVLRRAGAGGILHLPADTRNAAHWNAAAEAVARAAQARRPDTILFLSDTFGRMAAPAVAALCRTGVTADCTAVELSPDLQLRQCRPTYGGRFMAEIHTRTYPRIATVRPGVYGEQAYEIGPGELSRIAYRQPDGIQLVAAKPVEETGTDLTDTDIVFAGGAGLGSRENFCRLRKLAAFCGAGLGASRAAVAAGFAPYGAQVGQTGTIVRPRLYVAFGISGQIQHLCGMSDAETVVAVNKDPRAPIFEVCDYAIHADCVEVIHDMLSNLSEEKRK